MKELSRRGMIGGFVTGVAASLPILSASCAEGNKAEVSMPAAPPLKTYKNEDFYGADGKLDVAKAKQAYYEMMDHYRYPIPPKLKTDEFWTLDFGMGKFTELGMAGIFWINELEGDYFGHEIYLLPGQMIPEHKHVKTEKAGPKMEGWHVRHGWVYVYAEGEPTAGVEARIPPSHKECCKSKVETKLMPGEVATLAGAEQWHRMLAGPEGAIVSEYATFHDNDGLRFSHPDVKFP